MMARATGSSTQDRSIPEVARILAERVMRIPRQDTYMWVYGAYGLLHLFRATQDQRYLDFYLEHFPPGDNPFDTHLYHATGDRKYVAGVEERGAELLSEERRDREGAVLDPSGRYTVDVFCGPFTLPLICGHLLNDHRYFDEAARVMEIFRGYLEDPATGVWYSRWGHSMHSNRPNPGLWARGNGWLIDAWGRAMHLWDRSHPAYDDIFAAWTRICKGVAAFQTPSGLYRQLLDRPDCFEEASGTGLFSCGFGYGVINGTLGGEFADIAYRGCRGLEGLVDEVGNIHNVSTYAGGYNYERQYYSCGRFNDPHGDGTALGAFAAVMELAEKKPFNATEPDEKPVIVTAYIPDCISNYPAKLKFSDELTPPMLKRTLELDALPEHDVTGGTVMGLLHHSDVHRDRESLDHARALLAEGGDRLDDVVGWHLHAELAHRDTPGALPDGLIQSVDQKIEAMARDRTGVFLDDAGGYRVETLASWLPLLALCGAASGQRRYFDEACTQLFGHQRWLEEPESGLWYSAYGRGAHRRRVTPGLWTLGNAYVLSGIVGLLEHLPTDHPQYVDVICALRCLAHRVTARMPVADPFPQLLNGQMSNFCIASTALYSSAIGRATVARWIPATFWAGSGGAVWVMGPEIQDDGTIGFSSLQTGGLDRVEDYAEHRADNDPAALGFILSSLAFMSLCMKEGLDQHIIDRRLGAR